MNLQAEDIEFSYGRSQILKGIGFELRPGEVLGIIGPNGSGKTTLIKCINRILEPSQGKVTIDSRDVLSMKVRDVARIMGYVPQASLDDLASPTVFEVVMMGRMPHSSWQSNKNDQELTWKALEDVDMKRFASVPFRQLSSGQMQRVLIARALAQEARILLLDEPTSNLDIKFQREIMDVIIGLVKTRNVSACMILHDMDAAMKYCDKTVIVDGGAVTAAGDTEEVLTAENIMKTFGVKVTIDRNYGRPHIIVL